MNQTTTMDGSATWTVWNAFTPWLNLCLSFAASTVGPFLLVLWSSPAVKMGVFCSGELSTDNWLAPGVTPLYFSPPPTGSTALLPGTTGADVNDLCKFS